MYFSNSMHSEPQHRPSKALSSIFHAMLDFSSLDVKVTPVILVRLLKIALDEQLSEHAH